MQSHVSLIIFLLLEGFNTDISFWENLLDRDELSVTGILG